MVEDVFGEWTAYALRKSLVQREVELSRLVSNSVTKVVAVTGVRRCGKSSLLMLVAQKLAGEGRGLRTLILRIAG
ncbi:hypothetical protein AUJ65_03320 [Candidatus Micrarchaeota archaeon CG1_02_51_15]|nr:MAG: hypothetical protein AUJ65_03320 [Candidatus Micrarchaeota archaeon CG1_02_51_15]